MKPKRSKPGKPKTSGYKPLNHHWGAQPRDLPLFHSLYHVPLMMLEPTVRLGLAMRAGPLCQVEFAYKQGEEWKPGIESDDPMVAAFVERNLKRIWSNYIGGLLDAQKWGWAGAEVILKQTSGGMVEVAELLHRQANDTRPITSGGKVAGVRFLRIEGTDKGHVDLCFPYCLWHTYRPEPGQYFGGSICKGAFSPFWDKWMDGGALDVRRLFMHKDAYGGVDVSYPEGFTEIPISEGSLETRSVPNGNIAREMAEQIKAGGVTTRPSDYSADGKEKWTITRANVPANPAHILTYPKDLDTEIYRGMEIPDDVLESTEGAGGAWAGKTVPQGAFYTGLELWLRDLIVCIKTQVLDHLVKLNFGRSVWYEITTKPLALQATEQQGKQPSGAQAPPQHGNPLMMSLEAIGRGLPAEPFVRGARKVRRVRMSRDESGHEHKGKGEGGGQFTKGSGGSEGDAEGDFNERVIKAKANSEAARKAAIAAHGTDKFDEAKRALSEAKFEETRLLNEQDRRAAGVETKPGKTGEKTHFHALQEKHPELLKYAQSFDAIPKTKGGTVKHLNPRQTEIYNDVAKAKSEGLITKEEWVVAVAAIKEMDENTAQIGRRATAQSRDTAVVNLPLDKRGGGSLNSQIDRHKKETAKADKKKRSEDFSQSKDDKAEARRLFDQHADAMAERVAAKNGTKKADVLKYLDSMVKWEPKRAREFFAKVDKEQAGKPNA